MKYNSFTYSVFPIKYKQPFFCAKAKPTISIIVVQVFLLLTKGKKMQLIS